MITLQSILAAEPCYPLAEVEARFVWLARGRPSVGWHDVLACPQLTHADKLWVALELLMDDRQRRRFAVRCAGRALAIAPDLDPRAAAAHRIAQESCEGRCRWDEVYRAYEDALDVFDATPLGADHRREVARAVRHAVTACALAAARGIDHPMDRVRAGHVHLYAAHATQAATATANAWYAGTMARAPGLDTCLLQHELAREAVDTERARQLDDLTELVGTEQQEQPTKEKNDEPK